MKRVNGVLLPDDKDGNFFDRNRDAILSALKLLKGVSTSENKYTQARNEAIKRYTKR